MGEGGGWDCVRADFKPRELPLYLNKTYEILQLLLNFIGVMTSFRVMDRGHSLPPPPKGGGSDIRKKPVPDRVKKAIFLEIKAIVKWIVPDYEFM